ncbi:type VII secretion integral membrane protein EccD [Nocardiopsis sp. HNM0947]|uniref:Type VII secretion integral membrane protein EccD n=1 Tax=Nocardiopsis coralli TaxID=2772213 RepID=A0ABR9PAR0_9ACTN|nr:type VII secretion integral membrane protein EccD [Nocardiopsis coralli]MBE3000924.1 type VII secretion integral membrane protein EccD [Nocardiopsis coralli]
MHGITGLYHRLAARSDGCSQQVVRNYRQPDSGRIVNDRTDRKKAASLGGYSRVTVSGPERWADLALPDTVPVAALMPRVLEACVPEKEGNEAAGWSLTTAQEEALPLEGSLSAAGVADGDVLTLKREVAAARPHFVDDVRGAVEDRVDDSSGFWTHSTTFGFGLLLSSLLPLLVLMTMSWLEPSVAYTAIAAVGLIMVLPLVVVARRRSMHTVAHLLSASTALWGAVAGALTVFFVTGSFQLQNLVLFGLVGALVAAAVAWTLDEAGLPTLTALAFICLAGGVLMAGAFFLDIQQGARVLSLAMVLCVGGLPRVALVMGGLSALDYRVVNTGGVPTERFEETLETSDRLLLGVVLGAAAAGTATVPILLWFAEGPADRLLALAISVLLILRSRLFARVRHVLALRLGGVLGLALCLIEVTQVFPSLTAWAPAFALLAGAVVASLSWIKLGDVAQASLSRVLNWVEIVVVVGAFASAAWGAGVFDLVSEMTS